MIDVFRTIVEPLKCRGVINHRHGVMMIGSCFSDNIGKRLQQAYFNVEINPFGTLYNPASIACGINDILSRRTFVEEDLFQVKGDNRWHSFSHHSLYSQTDRQTMLHNINNHINEAHELLQQASILIVTFGTAWVYELIATNKIVANCHKLPENKFNRRLMSVEEIVTLWSKVVERLQKENNRIKIIFTISPIRHFRDGAHGNQISKSTLHVAVNKLIEKYNDILYFPAYEIMNDDLRDYRFYESDMVHPSDVAIDYIYKIFSQSFFDDETMCLAGECERLTRRLSHRHMSDDKEAIARFEKSTQEIKTQLLQQYPFLQQSMMKITSK